jgi:hypothetical protein
VEVYRRKVPTRYLEQLILFLEQPGNVQRVAFGKKVAIVLNGSNYVELDSISRSRSLMSLVTEFLLALDMEALQGVDLLPNKDRFTRVERDTF